MVEHLSNTSSTEFGPRYCQTTLKPKPHWVVCLCEHILTEHLFQCGPRSWVTSRACVLGNFQYVCACVLCHAAAEWRQPEWGRGGWEKLLDRTSICFPLLCCSGAGAGILKEGRCCTHFEPNSNLHSSPLGDQVLPLGLLAFFPLSLGELGRPSGSLHWG